MGGEVRWAGSALPTRLARTLVGGIGLVGGALCADDHGVCPRRTRLRSGRIADLALSRDAGKEDAVHAAWPVANPGNRPLGGPMPAGPPLWPSSTTTTAARLSRPCPRAPARPPSTRGGPSGRGPAGHRDGHRRRQPADQRRPGDRHRPEPDRAGLRRRLHAGDRRGRQ